jgi:hypothetical protein
MQAGIIDYGVSRPPAGQINIRLALLIAAFATLIGYPVYGLVRQTLSGGVTRTGHHFDVDLKSLGNFRFNDMTGQLADIPAKYLALDGKEVALEGLMYAENVAGDRAKSFQFVYNIQKCCIGAPPQVQERVFAAASGAGIPIRSDIFRIIGTLHVRIVHDKDTGRIVQVYSINVKRTEDL